MLADVEAREEETASFVAAIRLLTLTGCRLGEIQMLRWEHVDLGVAELRLRDGKTGACMVPLSSASVGILSALPRPDDNP